MKISQSSSDARVSRAAWGLWYAYGISQGLVGEHSLPSAQRSEPPVPTISLD